MTLRKGHMILGKYHVTHYVIKQALSHHMTLHMILRNPYMINQGIGQLHGHLPLQGLDVQCVY